MNEGFGHTPVLLAEVLEWLAPALAGQGPLVDCTVGGAGHSEAFLQALPELSVVAIDRDAEALRAAKQRLERFGDRVAFVKSNFAEIGDVLSDNGYREVAAILFDLGVSSPQLDRRERGFGYRPGFPLDMRMDRESRLTAAHVVNIYSENELSRVIARYGEERSPGGLPGQSSKGVKRGPSTTPVTSPRW